MKSSVIKGIGYYLPENIVKNKDLEEIMDTSDAWIQERTGIKERRWVDKDSNESTSSIEIFFFRASSRVAIMPYTPIRLAIKLGVSLA